MINNATPYTSFSWTASSCNLWSGQFCGGRNVYSADIPWVNVGTNISMPYCWGGWSTQAQHNTAMGSCKSAGDICSSGGGGCSGGGAGLSCSSGHDCSGLVSRAWATNSKQSTSSLPGISSSLALTSTQPGDIVNKVGSHTRLIETNYGNGNYRVIEASGADWKTAYHTYTTAQLSSYVPRCYDNVAGGCGIPPPSPAPVANFTVSSTTICQGTQVNFTDQSSNSPTSWSWSFPGGSPGSSTAQNPTVTYNTAGTFNVTLTATNSGGSNTLTRTNFITVIAGSVGGTVASSASVCSGSNSGTLTLSGYTGTILRWQYSTDGGITWINIANTSSTQTYNNLTTTTMYRAVVKSGICPAANSSPATITVDPVTVGGTVSGNTTVCSGANSGTLTLSGHVGSVLRWQYSTDGGVTWTNITNTTTTQTFTNLTTTTMYRAVVKSGVCPSANSSPATITVDPVTVGGIVLSDATVCSGSNSGTLTLSGHVGNVLRWQYSTDSGATWTNIFNTTTTLTYNNLITTIPNQQTTILYRAVVKSGVCPPENSSAATITIDPVTVGGTVAFDATVCKNSNSGTLTLTAQVGIVLNWEYSIDGGVTWTNIANTTTSQNYNNLTTTTMYLAVVKSGVCPIENSIPATIIILDTMSVGGTIFSSATVCSGANIGTLTLTSQVGNVLNWEYSTDGGITWATIPNTTALQSYNNLTITTMYRAVVQSGICPTENSATATITVDPVTVPGTVSGSVTVCRGSNSGMLTLNGQTGNVLRWESSNDGGITWINIANTTITQTYSNLTATTIYRAVVQSGVCLPGNSATATVAVDPVSVGGIIPGNTVCSGANNGTLTLNNYVGNVLQWEFLTDGEMTWTTIANTTNTQSYTNISTVTRYRAIVQSGVCPADTSSIAVLFLFPITVADAGVDTSISLGYTVTLNGKGGEIYNWSPETDLNDPDIANPIATPLETITYTLTVIDENGCEDTDPVTITVLVDYNFIISNLITPNGDGYNDTWHIDNIENYPDCEVLIYNRYGNLIFNSSPYMQEWEGIYKGNQLPDGTYYYVLKCPEDNVFKGGITILRQN